jgi:hypothetical protein
MTNEPRSREGFGQPIRDYSKIEYEPNKEAVITLAFDAVKIKMFIKQGTPIPAGVSHVIGSHFEVEAPGVDPLLVKRVHIMAAGVTFNYEGSSEFDLPACLEVGTDGILQKTVQAHLPVQIVSRVVKETPESELPTKQMMDGSKKCSRCQVPGHTASECKLLPPPGTQKW